MRLLLLFVPTLAFAQPKEVRVVDTNGLTVEQIQKVMKDSAGKFRACFQQRTPKVAQHKVTVQFKIGKDGVVKSGRVRETTPGWSAVESCLVSRVMRLKFPVSETPSSVTYPFVYANQ